MRSVVYCRISQDRGGEKQGVDRQLKDCLSLAEREGHALVAEPFIDNNVSAYSGKPRPAFREMVKLIESDGIEAVIVWHLDRLYRSARELEDLIDLVEGQGLFILSVTGADVDLSNSDGILLARIQTAVARKSSDDSRRRIKASKAEARDNGRWQGSRRPFGYRLIGGHLIDGHPATLELDPVEAPIVRGLVQAALAGQSLYRSAADLNDGGILTEGGNRWHPSHVRRMMLSPFASGRYPLSHDRKTCPKAKGKGERKRCSCVFVAGPKTGSWPILVTPDEQKLIRAKLSRRRGTPRGTTRYLLSSIATCAACGTAIVGSSDHYRCSSQGGGCSTVSVKTGPLDRYVLEAARSEIARRILDRMPADHVDAPPTAVELEHADILREMARIQDDLDAIPGRLHSGVYDDRQAKIAGDDLRTDLAGLQAKLDAETKHSPVRLSESDIELLEQWTPERLQEVRDLLKGMIERLTLSRGADLPGLTPKGKPRHSRGWDPERVSIVWRQT